MKKLNELTTRTPLGTDIIYGIADDGSADHKITVDDLTVIPETTRTINLDNSMTASEIQDEINSVGRFIPSGVTITYQFANGTYTLEHHLQFYGFYGGGQIYIQGDTSEGIGPYTSQAVHLNFNNSTHGILHSFNSVSSAIIQNLKITAVDGYICFHADQAKQVQVGDCFLTGTGTVSGGGRCFQCISGTKGYLYRTNVSNSYMALHSTSSAKIYSFLNVSTGTIPKYGLRVSGGTIGKNSTQPTGSLANELVLNGGEIF